jgi:hypothetical protein
MRRFKVGARIATSLLLAATAIACGSSSGDTSGGGGTQVTPPPSQTVTDKGIVSGVVREANGSIVGSTRVTIDTLSVQANEQGFFVIEGIAPGADKTLTFSKTGYVTGNKQVTVRAGQQSHLDLSLAQVGVRTTSVSSSSTAVIADDRADGKNGQVSIPAGAVVDAAGNAVTSYTAEVTTMLPSDPAYNQTFPGSFMGGATAGSTASAAPLRSFGVINVELKDAQGNALRLASGKQAALTFPIDSSAAHDPGTATVPLWYLDPATGIWIEEGVATRTGSTYVAQVSHFTPWNLDVRFGQSVTKEVHVRGLNNAPVANATVIVDGTGYRQVAGTGVDGIARLTVRPSDTLRVSAQKGTLVSSVTTETAPGSGTLVNYVDLVEPLATVMLTWGATPSDLDSHLTGPGGIHVYFSSMGSKTTAPFAELDTDDTNSYGPEITTITKLDTGTYRFSVHNYSGQSQGPIEASGAVVNLIVPRTGVIRRYAVPTSNPANGNLWAVFELVVDATGGVQVQDLSQFSTVAGASQVP